MKFTRLSLIGVTFIAIGAACGIIQNVFYGWIDADGFIHDSLFLPLSYLFLFAGALLLLISILINLLGRNKR
ncbi:MAG: DUF3955 domain-containing protein [Candidatus Dadabacteria bacterium]|nr:DUF3955 domain-containing protein [Candidatus Dadabacteria bacterium]